MRLLESCNLYPDCALLHLEATSTSPSTLYFSLNFGQQEMPLFQGSIKFGLKAAKLQLSLKNSEISALDSAFGDLWPITTIASPTEPAWILTPQPGKSFLTGSLPKVNLGIITATATPCLLVATLEVSPSDISVLDAQGLWRHDISPNKLGVLERAIALFLLTEDFQPYLSWSQLAMPEPNTWFSLANKVAVSNHEASLSQLEATIEQVYVAKSDCLLDLAHLAGLNPQDDLAGGNFVATQLAGIELGGANLCCTNFRGADLTDADLSEANLSQARLSGADLSGAYLGDANLSHADLHRASLALANLIGADLTGANLEGANLSQTNLSGAQVTGAKFNDNPGLSEEMQLNLQQRGAILNS